MKFRNNEAQKISKRERKRVKDSKALGPRIQEGDQ